VNPTWIEDGPWEKDGILDVDVGRDHTIVVSNKGIVWTWGSNEWGQLGKFLFRIFI